MKRCLESMVVAFSMYSKIPMPQITWTKDNMRHTLCYFPLIGAVIGALLYVWYWLCGFLQIGVMLQAAIAVLIPVVVTGGIHLDGFLDTSDALSSWQTQERRLEILKDPHTGAFAIIVCCSYFLAAFGIWTEARPKDIPVLALGFILSRTLSGFGVCKFPCAKNSGLAATFAQAADRTYCTVVLVIEMLVCMVAMICLDPTRGTAACVAAVITCIYCRQMAMRKFGGITGDIQGYFLQVCELVMAFVVILKP